MNGRRAELGILEAIDQPNEDDRGARDDAAVSLRQGETSIDEVADALGRGRQRDAGRLVEPRPDRPEDTANRHVGKNPEYDQRQQGAQIAAADAREVAARAAAGEDHPVAEHQAARDVAEPIEAGAEVHGFREVDDAEAVKDLRAGQSRDRRENPRPEPPEVAEIHDVGH